MMKNNSWKWRINTTKMYICTKQTGKTSQVIQRNLVIQIDIVYAQKTFVLQSLENMRYLI